MPRTLKEGWLQAYRKYIYKQEAPDAFHLWIGLTVISAALKRHVWIDRKAYTVYPNLYTFLVAESAECRKSVAMELGLDILSLNEDVKVVHERTTLEGLMDQMNRSEITPGGKGIRPDGSILLHADELSNLFGKASYISDLVSFLTAAYTSRAKLDFLTRNKGWVKVRNPCPVVLAGTTPEALREIFPSSVLSSGFMGRVVLVLGKSGVRIGRPELKSQFREPLAQDLYLIGQIDGEMKLTEECDNYFVDWYEHKMHGPISKDLASFYQRKHDHALKVAMLLSVSASDEMVVTLDHLKSAIDIVDHVELQLPATIRYIGAVEGSDLHDVILSVIKRSPPGGVAHSTLLRRFIRKYKNAAEFKAVIDTLVEERLIKPEGRKTGIFYHFIEENPE
uniref:Uncharacterized protein n=1 Tax=viral metagenome TaxID=1070528 RepID=A0A6M3MAK9_9ZZZZ